MDPRRRFPKWLRWTVVFLELPVMVASLIGAVLLGFLWAERLPSISWFGVIVTIASYALVRMIHSNLRHQLTGQ